jgi:ATP-dependent Clp protease ATP-binding subunit ClpC
MKSLFEHALEFKSSITLEHHLSRKTLSFFRLAFLWSWLLLGLTALAAATLFGKQHLALSLLGASFILFSFWFEQTLLFSYHNSFYYKGLNSIIGLDEEPVFGTTYEVSRVILPSPEDITFAFCTSALGSNVLMRTGLAFSDVDAFLQQSRKKISAHEIMLAEDEFFTLISLGTYILTQDLEFNKLLKEKGIKTETYVAALKWIIISYNKEKQAQRWWSKDSLSKTQGIGREWTYGTAFLLQKFSRSINTTAVFSMLTNQAPYAQTKISKIETILARSRSANALIIGEPGVGKIDLVMEVKRRIENGTSLGAITGKQLIALDTNRLFATHKEKTDLEYTLLALFSEALHSGNIVIVIENLSVVIREAQALGVFIPELLDEYLSSPFLQVIATDTPGAYHTYLEPLGGFVRRFEEVLIETPNTAATVRILESIVPDSEMRHHTIFTYGALEAVAVAAERHIVEGDMPDKAVTLLTAVAAEAGQSHVEIITSDFVYSVVSAKTGIPAGPIQDNERDLLLHLEEKLHEQVIGQERALLAIARTMRRARVGIQASDKPIGSFLFLGPTGVGKTETAKALANIFFGSEAAMLRLDMSEYSGADALIHLIGDGEVSGTLPNMLREHPYAVLLLDEFEKATRSVHDLFLQILDEGIFTDARGAKVNARNTIIIATSNAGSALIMKTVEQRKELAHLTQEIINHIIHDGIFRPELINRFSSTIIFEPLTLIEQGRVARLMLGGLYERIKEKGYELEISDDLLDALVQKGYSPEFGARPMERVLQDIVEEKVAAKIIGGEVQRGDTIHLTRDDVTDAELST